MYRRILARVLAGDFVMGRGWSEEAALELGRQVLRGNVETIFDMPMGRLKAAHRRGAPASE
jgi:glucuronate isomerase